MTNYELLAARGTFSYGFSLRESEVSLSSRRNRTELKKSRRDGIMVESNVMPHCMQVSAGRHYGSFDKKRKHEGGLSDS